MHSWLICEVWDLLTQNDHSTGFPPRRRGFRSVTLLHAGFCFRYATTLVAPSSDRKNGLFYHDTSHVNAQMKYLSVTL